MIRPGFLDRESRQDLIELARNGSAAHRLARRANALVLLDDGMSCEAIAKVLLLDDDTIRTWYRLYEEDGIEGLTNFGYWAKKAAGQKVTENTYATMTTFEGAIGPTPELARSHLAPSHHI
jgi:transposase